MLNKTRLCDFCCTVLKDGERVGVQFWTNSDTGEEGKSCACPTCTEILMKLSKSEYTIEELNRLKPLQYCSHEPTCIFREEGINVKED